MIEQYYTVRGANIVGQDKIFYVALNENHPYYDDVGDEFEDELYFSLCRYPTDLFDTIEEAEAFVVEIKEYSACNPYINTNNLEIVRVTVEKISTE